MTARLLRAHACRHPPNLKLTELNYLLSVCYMVSPPLKLLKLLKPKALRALLCVGCSVSPLIGVDFSGYRRTYTVYKLALYILSTLRQFCVPKGGETE